MIKQPLWHQMSSRGWKFMNPILFAHLPNPICYTPFLIIVPCIKNNQYYLGPAYHIAPYNPLIQPYHVITTHETIKIPKDKP